MFIKVEREFGVVMASKLCDSCKCATARLFCRADSAFLCSNCDSKIHAANKLASRHARVWVCEVCEQAPAHVTCKADAAALCVACDQDIHSANPLAQRHERVPVTPFSHPDAVAVTISQEEEEEEEEAEAASWLLPNPKPLDSPDMMTSAQYLFPDMDPYLDLDNNSPDGVVPVQNKPAPNPNPNPCTFDLDFSGSGPKQPFITYNFANPTPSPNPTLSHSHSHSVSSSSVDVGVVPDGGGGMAESHPAVAMSAVEREARVLRYREKRKNRKFEKTIRYASRKAYAETRPRIKGRFAKRTEMDTSSCGYGVVPSF